MNDLVQSQYLIEELTNIIENQTKAVSDIQVHRPIHLVPQNIVAINHQPITSTLHFYSLLSYNF